MAHLIPQVHQTESPVGDGKTNLPADVLLVATMLNDIASLDPGWAPASPLPRSGTYTSIMKQWIAAFQQRTRKKNPASRIAVDGAVHPMPGEDSLDYSAKFSDGTYSTLYALNSVLSHLSVERYRSLGSRLGLQAVFL
jgi:hypothetical protein